MSGHDGTIGQEWTGESWRDRPLPELFARLAGQDRGLVFIVLGYLSAADPRVFREAVMTAEHSTGLHADGRCPETCPRF